MSGSESRHSAANVREIAVNQIDQSRRANELR